MAKEGNLKVAVTIRETDQQRVQAWQEIMRLVGELRSRGAVLIVLFGSRARDDATRWSDIDLLVVLPCPTGETYAGRLARLATELNPRVPLDLLAYTPEEFASLKESSLFVKQVLAEGKVLHAR